MWNQRLGDMFENSAGRWNERLRDWVKLGKENDYTYIDRQQQTLTHLGNLM